MAVIHIFANAISIKAELNHTPTAQAIYNALPIEGIVSTWGDEIYFSIPLTLPLEPQARAEVNIGELGYWPTGQAFCIFFGPTPASKGKNPQAASPVNVLGHITGDTTPLKSIGPGAAIRIEKAD